MPNGCVGKLKRLPVHSVFLLLLVSSPGCVSTGPKLSAEAMSDNGLVVAHFASNHPGALIYYGDAQINGEVYDNAINGRYLTVQLKPGRYRLERISRTNRSTNYSAYGGVNITTISSTKYDLTANFEVQSGRVTNLGTVLIYFEDKSGSKRQTHFIDNSREMQQYLKTKYPQIYGSTRSKTLQVADENYLSEKQINDLRYKMVRDLPKASYENKYAGGYIGSFYRFEKNPQGKITGVKLLETGTYHDINNCDAKGSRFACVIPATREGNLLYITQDNRIVKREMPAIEPSTPFELVGREGIVFFDRRLRIDSSFDNGHSWQRYTKATLNEPIGSDYRVRIDAGKNGFYVFSGDDDSTLLYRPYGKVGNFSRIPPPQDGFNITGIVETSKGIYTHPEYSLLSTSRLFFKPNGAGQWVERQLPARECSNGYLINYDTDVIAVKCINRFYASQDKGQTWRQVTRSELKNLN